MPEEDWPLASDGNVREDAPLASPGDTDKNTELTEDDMLLEDEIPLIMDLDVPLASSSEEEEPLRSMTVSYEVTDLWMVNLLAETSVDLEIEKELMEDGTWDYLNAESEAEQSVRVRLKVAKAEGSVSARTITLKTVNPEFKPDLFQIAEYYDGHPCIEKAELSPDKNAITYTIDNSLLGEDGLEMEVIFSCIGKNTRAEIQKVLINAPNFDTFLFAATETTNPENPVTIEKELKIKKDYPSVFIDPSQIVIVDDRQKPLFSDKTGLEAMTDGTLKFFPQNDYNEGRSKWLTFTDAEEIPSAYPIGYFYIPLPQEAHMPVRNLEITIPFPEGFGDPAEKDSDSWVLKGNAGEMHLGTDRVTFSPDLKGNFRILTNADALAFLGVPGEQPHIAFSVNKKLNAEKTFFEYPAGENLASAPISIRYEQIRKQDNGTYDWETVSYTSNGPTRIDVPAIDFEETPVARVQNGTYILIPPMDYKLTVYNQASDAQYQKRQKARTYKNGELLIKVPKEADFSSISFGVTLAGQAEKVQYKTENSEDWKKGTEFPEEEGRVTEIKIPLPAEGIGEKAFDIILHGSVISETGQVPMDLIFSSSEYQSEEKLTVYWKAWTVGQEIKFTVGEKTTPIFLGELPAVIPPNYDLPRDIWSGIYLGQGSETKEYATVELEFRSGDGEIPALALLDTKRIGWPGNNAPPANNYVKIDTTKPAKLLYTVRNQEGEENSFVIEIPAENFETTHYLNLELKDGEVLTSLKLHFDNVKIRNKYSVPLNRPLLHLYSTRQRTVLNVDGKEKQVEAGSYPYKWVMTADGNTVIKEGAFTYTRTVEASCQPDDTVPAVEVPKYMALGKTNTEAITVKLPGWKLPATVDTSKQTYSGVYPEGTKLYLPLGESYLYAGGNEKISSQLINGQQYLIYDISGQSYTVPNEDDVTITIPAGTILCMGEGRIFEGTGYIDYGPMLALDGEEVPYIRFNRHNSMVENVEGISGVLLPVSDDNLGEAPLVTKGGGNLLMVLSGMEGQGEGNQTVTYEPSSHKKLTAQALIMVNEGDGGSCTDYKLTMELTKKGKMIYPTPNQAGGETSEITLHPENLADSVTVKGYKGTSNPEVRYLDEYKNEIPSSGDPADVRFVEVTFPEISSGSTITVDAELQMAEEEIYQAPQGAKAYVAAFSSYVSGGTKKSDTAGRLADYQFRWDTISGTVFEENQEEAPDGIYQAGKDSLVESQKLELQYRISGSGESGWKTPSSDEGDSELWQITMNSGKYTCAIKPSPTPYEVKVDLQNLKDIVLTWGDKTDSGSSAFPRGNDAYLEFTADADGLSWSGDFASSPRKFDDVNVGYYNLANMGVTMTPDPLTAVVDEAKKVTFTPAPGCAVTAVEWAANPYASAEKTSGDADTSWVYQVTGNKSTDERQTVSVTAQDPFGETTIEKDFTYTVSRNAFVTFNKGAGAWADPSLGSQQQVEVEFAAYGSGVLKRKVPVVVPPENYIFEGWKVNTTDEVKTSEEVENMTTSAGMVFTAQYALKKYKVTFSADTNQDGTDYTGTLSAAQDSGIVVESDRKTAALQVEHGKTVTKYPKVETAPNSGYAFLYWAVYDDATNTYQPFAEDQLITGPVTLHAYYGADTNKDGIADAYQIQFEYQVLAANFAAGNGFAEHGSTEKLQTVTEWVNVDDQNQAKPTVAFAVVSGEHYQFDSWSYIENGQTVTVSTDQLKEKAFVRPDSGKITFTAGFSRNEYVVSFEAEAGKGTIDSSQKTVVVSADAAKLSEDQIPAVTPVPGYVHIGWKTADGRKVTKPAELLNLLSETIDSDVTFTAVMESAAEFIVKDGIVLSGESIVLTQDEIGGLTTETIEQAVLTKSGASAWNILTAENADVSASGDLISNPGQAKETGGIYKVSLQAEFKGTTVIREILVAVEGSRVGVSNLGADGAVTDQTTALYAEPFAKAYNDEALKEETAIEKANTKAYLLKAKTELASGIQVSEDQLKAINAVGPEGTGEKGLPLTFSVNGAEVAVSVTVATVTVRVTFNANDPLNEDLNYTGILTEGTGFGGVISADQKTASLDLVLGTNLNADQMPLAKESEDAPYVFKEWVVQSGDSYVPFKAGTSVSTATNIYAHYAKDENNDGTADENQIQFVYQVSAEDASAGHGLQENGAAEQVLSLAEWITLGIQGEAGKAKPSVKVTGVPLNSHYEFKGWTYDNQTSPVTSEALQSTAFERPESGIITFTAAFQKKQYEVSFAAEGGNGSVTPEMVLVEAEKTLGQALSELPKAEPNSGFVFTGWRKQGQAGRIELGTEQILAPVAYVAELMPEEQVTVNGSLALTGNSVVLSQIDLAGLTEENCFDIIVSKAGARAWDVNTGKFVTGAAGIRIAPDSPSGLTDIVSAGKDGGIYEMILQAGTNPDIISRRIIVVVEGSQVTIAGPDVEGNETKERVALYAKSFHKVYDEAALDSKTALGRAEAKAYLLESRKPAADTSILLNQDELKAINDVGPEGTGENGLPLTFSVSGAEVEVSVTVATVTVKVIFDANDPVNEDLDYTGILTAENNFAGTISDDGKTADLDIVLGTNLNADQMPLAKESEDALYVFKEWMVWQGDEYVPFTTGTSISADTTIYAHYTADINNDGTADEKQIQFVYEVSSEDAVTGHGLQETGQSETKQTVEEWLDVDDKNEAAPAVKVTGVPANTHYEFVGWIYDGQPIPVTAEELQSTAFERPDSGKITFTANFQKKEYTVTFTAENGKGTVNPETAEVEAEKTLGQVLTGGMPEVTPVDGYVFVGWKNQKGSCVDLAKEQIIAPVTYTAELMEEDQASLENGLALTGTGVVLNQKDLEAENLESLVVQKAGAEAWNMTTGEELTVSISNGDLEQLASAKEKGGIYTITLQAGPEEGRVSREILLVVAGSQTAVAGLADDGSVTEDTVALHAEPFAKAYNEEDLTADTAREKAHTEAYAVKAGTRLDKKEIRVNAEDLKAVNAIQAEGGSQNVRFSVKDAEVFVTVTVARETATVTFTADCGTLSFTSKDVVLETRLGKENIPAVTPETGYEHAGWARADVPDTLINLAEEVITEAVTYVAVMKKSEDENTGHGSGSSSMSSTSSMGKWLNTGWTFVKAGGQKAAGEWLAIDGKIYRFTANGFMDTTYQGLQFAADGSLVNPADAKTLPAVAAGTWVKDGWRYELANGGYLQNSWYYLSYQGRFSWYYFDADGWMLDGWLDDRGNRYYLHTVHDYTRGRMYEGWHQIGGKWYYFYTKDDKGITGALVRNGKTPDGYTVDENGVWDGRPAEK